MQTHATSSMLMRISLYALTCSCRLMSCCDCHGGCYLQLPLPGRHLAGWTHTMVVSSVQADNSHSLHPVSPDQSARMLSQLDPIHHGLVSLPCMLHSESEHGGHILGQSFESMQWQVAKSDSCHWALLLPSKMPWQQACRYICACCAGADAIWCTIVVHM